MARRVRRSARLAMVLVAVVALAGWTGVERTTFHDQRGGKLLYPLRVSQARCLQDPKVLAFIDKLKGLPPGERHAVLAMATQQISLLKACLIPAGSGLYKLDPGLIEEEETPIDDGLK